jgi:hypothetical protein
MLHRTILAGVTCLAVLATGIGTHAQRDAKNPKEENPRPKFSLKAQPNVGIAPARVILTAELNGGANDLGALLPDSVVGLGRGHRIRIDVRLRAARGGKAKLGGMQSSTSSKPARTKCGYG